MNCDERDIRHLIEVAVERRRQRGFGHDEAADDAMPHGHLLREALDRLHAAHELLTIAGGGEAPRIRARRKCVQAAALCLAELARIDRDFAKGKENAS